MAIMVPNTISDLTYKARSLGILNSIKGSKKDGSYRKEDLIIPIRNKILRDNYGSNVPEYINLLLNIKSPMLSKRIDEVSSDLQDEIWEDDNWSFEEKINGVRCLIIKDNNGIHFISRDNSRETLLPIEMPILLDTTINEINVEFILDCELESQNSNTCMYLQDRCGTLSESNTSAIEMMLTSMSPVLALKMQEGFDFKYVFNVFDCLYCNGRWLTSETLYIRRQVVSRLVNLLSGKGINLREVKCSQGDKQGFYNMCISSGYEGCIAKRLDSEYIADSVRNVRGWIKIKRVINRERKLPEDIPLGQFSLDYLIVGDRELTGDTIDAFITGFNLGREGSSLEGKVESLNVSAWVLNSNNEYEEKPLGSVQVMDDNIRDSITSDVSGILTLNPSFYNSVVELDALGSTVIRFRYDKSAQECILESSTYNQIIGRKIS